MAQTSKCPLHGGSYKPPLGVYAIYSETTVYMHILFRECVFWIQHGSMTVPRTMTLDGLKQEI